MGCEAGLKEAVSFGSSLEPKKNSSEGLGPCCQRPMHWLGS